jgi:lauroyl/myristoyl acyltransferase
MEHACGSSGRFFGKILGDIPVRFGEAFGGILGRILWEIPVRFGEALGKILGRILARVHDDVQHVAYRKTRKRDITLFLVATLQ